MGCCTAPEDDRCPVLVGLHLLLHPPKRKKRQSPSRLMQTWSELHGSHAMSAFHLQVSSADSAYVFDFNKAFGEASTCSAHAAASMRDHAGLHGVRYNTCPRLH